MEEELKAVAPPERGHGGPLESQSLIASEEACTDLGVRVRVEVGIGAERGNRLGSW